ncbi:hypothetical protein AVEN_195681-1 [Araneus ventricosus]|uniref:Uncharacterized protein n=1 Tax=Araneus ventricosus TaxID=182803 RepID=A0A4Y2BBN4_ARAVE|nr:hypothetical protein AVEN_195681-1 [Araneus ventricosus]
MCILEFLHGVLQLSIMLVVLLVFKLLEICYDLSLFGHKGGVERQIVPEENTTEDSASSTRSSTSYHASTSTTYRSSAYSTTTYSS